MEVDDNLAILASTSDQSALVINQNSTGDLISATTGQTAKFTVSNSGSGIFAGDLSILGNNLSTVTGTFNLANTNTTTLNIGGAATNISIGAATGTTTVNNNLKVNGLLNLPSIAVGSVPFINTSNQLAQDTANFFWDQGNKRLGLGTSTPSYRLSVTDNVSQAGRATAAITNINATDSINSVALRLNIGAPAASTQSRFATFYANCSSEDCAGTAKGNIAVTTTGVAYNTGSADFAEYFSADDNTINQGDIVGLDSNGKVVKATSNTPLVGVLSTTAGFVGNDTSDRDSNANKVLVGLMGQLPVKVSNENGIIKAGDPLTVSSIPGVASKAVGAGQIVGRALETFDPLVNTSNKIKIALNVSWYDPRAILMNDGSLATAFETNKSKPSELSFGDYEKYMISIRDFVNTLNTGVLEVANISTNSLSIATEDITIGGQTLRNYIASIVNEILDKRLAEEKPKNIVVLSPLAQAPSSATVSADMQTANPPAATAAASLTPTPTNPIPSPTATQSATYVTNIYNNVSSTSAGLASTSASLSPTPELSISPTPSPEITASPSAQPTPIATESAQIQNTQTTQQNSKSEIQDIRESEITDTLSIPSFPNLQTNHANIATFSAELSYIPNLKSDYATFNHGLIALGPTSLAETSISTQLSIGQSMVITENSINTLGTDLNLQPLKQGNLLIMGGLVAVDTQGNLSVTGNAAFAKDVTVKGKLAAGIIVPVPDQDLIFQLGENTPGNKIEVKNASGSGVLSINKFGDIISSGSAQFSNFKIVRGAQADTSFTETVAKGSAGTAVITANETERTIVTPFVTKDSLIYITPVSSTSGTTPYIARQIEESSETASKGSFTIQISSPVSSDIKLNWWIIN